MSDTLAISERAKDYARHYGCEVLDAELWFAAETHDLKRVRELLGRGADVHFVNPPDGDTLMHTAAHWGSQRLMRMLLDKGFLDVDRPNNEGLSAIAVARLQASDRGPDSSHETIASILRIQLLHEQPPFKDRYLDVSQKSRSKPRVARNRPVVSRAPAAQVG